MSANDAAATGGAAHARTESDPRRRRPDIQGLRALAVLLVVLFHGGADAHLPGGFTGVDVFFAISGFVITGSDADMISNLQTALTKIMQGSIQIVLLD